MSNWPVGRSQNVLVQPALGQGATGSPGSSGLTSASAQLQSTGSPTPRPVDSARTGGVPAVPPCVPSAPQSWFNAGSSQRSTAGARMVRAPSPPSSATRSFPSNFRSTPAPSSSGVNSASFVGPPGAPKTPSSCAASFVAAAPPVVGSTSVPAGHVVTKRSYSGDSSWRGLPEGVRTADSMTPSRCVGSPKLSQSLNANMREVSIRKLVPNRASSSASTSATSASTSATSGSAASAASATSATSGTPEEALLRSRTNELEEKLNQALATIKDLEGQLARKSDVESAKMLIDVATSKELPKDDSRSTSNVFTVYYAAPEILTRRDSQRHVETPPALPATPPSMQATTPPVMPAATPPAALPLASSPGSSRELRSTLSAQAPPGSPPASASAPPATPTAGAGTSTAPKHVECEVEIAHRIFELLMVIGRGAFGIVWLANEKGIDSKEIAVKAVTAKDFSGFVSAAFEAELLQILTAAMPAVSKAHVPQYVAHSAVRSSSGGGVVRLAMSFVPGGALDKWLYGISDEEHKTVDVAQLVDGHLPGGQQGSWWFTNCCSVVRTLLSQLAAVFAALQPIAFHRDVSSHNVLVDFPCGEDKPSFALIDFGLAVRSGSWNREWRNSNLAGDPRYWTPTAWMAFAFGFKYVATHPNSGFEQQYLHRMDHFSLGVLCLEVLFALWHTGEAYEGKHPGLLEVRAAWCKYWVAVIYLFQMFHRQGAQEVRQFLSQSQDEGVTHLCNHLRQLRQSLRTAAVHPLNARCGALLRVLADLLDEKGTVSWVEIPRMLAEDMTSETPKSPSLAGSQRSSMALIEPPTPVQRAENGGVHRRLRSTGSTLDQERRRYEPEISQAVFKARYRTESPERKPQPVVHAPQLSQWGGSPIPVSRKGYSPDLLSRSYTHARPVSGYM